MVLNVKVQERIQHQKCVESAARAKVELKQNYQGRDSKDCVHSLITTKAQQDYHNICNPAAITNTGQSQSVG